MSRVLRSGLAIVALLVSLLLVPALAGAAPTPPPTLTGEVLRGVSEGNSRNTLSCNQSGPGATDWGGTFSFGATGIATGPYVGTYTETGSATIAPDGTLTAFEASFTIDSPLGIVTGTKTLVSGWGYCDGFRGVVTVIPLTTYQATITTPGGSTYTDSGTTTGAGIQTGFDRIPQSTGMEEIFTSSRAATTPGAPTSKEQCKDGGYARFTDPATGQPFTNQGQCIKFVHSGK